MLHNGSTILEPLGSTQSNQWRLLKVSVAHFILFMKQQDFFKLKLQRKYQLTFGPIKDRFDF